MAFVGPWEIALILVVVFILFGPKRLPELAKGIGEAMRNYREASEEITPSSETTPSKRSEEEALIKTATRLGIETEGKTLETISNEIVIKNSRKKK
ncbi:Sec-independent protein translocase subunit TatA/TatB [[Eubacterium] cellulosolvens]